MKIKHLKISKFKNLENVDLQFNSELITLLVGQNGLGKSNLLEAIAFIFRELDLLEREEDFNNWSHNNFNYEIQYECKGAEVWIQCEDGMFRLSTKTAKTDESFLWKSIAHFKRYRKQFLPDYIIGYYSGENNRIKSFFEKHSEKRINILKSRNPDPDFPALGRMFFTEQNYGELLFFALWVFKEKEPFKEKIKNLLKGYLGIELSSEVLIAFNNPLFAKNFLELNVDNLLSNIQDSIENPFWGLKGKVDFLLRSFYNNNSAHSLPIAFNDEEYDKDKSKYEFISFNNLDFSILADDLEEQIKDPIHLFDVLLAAHELGIIHEIKTNLKKNGQTITHDFKELSEGERQLLTVIGLILISGVEDCLFLLDEPDTHLNPRWQRDYVSLLHEFNLNDVNSHILVATHSPLIVQAAEKADILLYKKDSKDKVKILNNDELKIHNWRIDQVLASDFFEFKNTRPPELDEFMEERERLLSKSILTNEDFIRIKEMEEGLSLLPSGETINDFKAMHLVRTIAKEIKESGKN